MRRLALVGGVALGCSVVNPLFDGGSSAASRDEGATGDDETGSGPGSGTGPGPDSGDDGDDTTGSPPEETTDGDATDGPSEAVVLCPELLWLATPAKDVYLARVDDWQYQQFPLPAEFSGGASAIVSKPLSGRVYAFSDQGGRLALRDPWEPAFSDVPFEPAVPILRASCGRASDDVYLIEEGGEDLLVLTGNDESGYDAVVHRPIANEIFGDGDLAPFDRDGVEGLILYLRPDIFLHLPLDPKLEVTSLVVEGPIASSVYPTGLAAGGGDTYWVSTETAMWHLTYQDARWRVSTEDGYGGSTADTVLRDLAPVYLSGDECVALRDGIGG